MTKYQKGEAREWALASLRGCCGCVSPTFTADLTELNEAAIRHDVALEKAYGMSGVLIVSEAGTTAEEMARFVEIVVDEAGDDLVTVLQASQPTLADTVASAEHGARAGVDGQFFIAIDIAAFLDPSTFRDRVDRIVDQVHASPRRPDVDRLYVPGEIEADIAREYQRDGILLAGTTLDDILATAAKLGVDASLLALPEHGPSK